jgi:hypothetical protein
MKGAVKFVDEKQGEVVAGGNIQGQKKRGKKHTATKNNSWG